MANHFVKRLKKMKISTFNEIYTNIFSRHFSFVLYNIFLYLYQPKSVTIWMFASGLAEGFNIYSDIQNLAYGSLFFVLLNILDASDGELARFKGMVTKGRLLDR